jgi:hypothetical protein
MGSRNSKVLESDGYPANACSLTSIPIRLSAGSFKLYQSVLTIIEARARVRCTLNLLLHKITLNLCVEGDRIKQYLEYNSITRDPEGNMISPV